MVELELVTLASWIRSEWRHWWRDRTRNTCQGHQVSGVRGILRLVQQTGQKRNSRFGGIIITSNARSKGSWFWYQRQISFLIPAPIPYGRLWNTWEGKRSGAAPGEAGGLQYLAVVVDPLEQLLSTVYHRTHLHTVSQFKQVAHNRTDLLVHCSLGDLAINLEAGREHQPDRLGVRQPSLHGMHQTGMR